MSANFETFLKLFGQLCSSSGGLLGPVIQALEPMRKMAQEIEDAGRGMAVDVNPTVAMAIADLKVLYHNVGGKARLYITSCKNIASYVCESEVLEAIEKELKERETEELTNFLDDILDYLNGCKSSLEQFNAIHKQFQTEAKQSSDEWYGEANKKIEEEKIYKLVSRGFGIAGATLGVGGVGAAVVSTITCPPVLLVLTAGASVSAAASLGVAGVFALESGISNEKKKVFVDAAKLAVDLYKALIEVEIKIRAMEVNLESVKTYIGGRSSNGRNGLTEMVKRASSGGQLNIRRINEDLKQLKMEMEKTLQQARGYLDYSLHLY